MGGNGSGGGKRFGGGGAGGGAAGSKPIEAKRETQPVGSAKQQRAADNFIKGNQAGLNSSQGVQIAANEFSYAGMSNEQALRVMNSRGNTKYEIYTQTQAGSLWTNFAPVKRTYIRRKR